MAEGGDPESQLAIKRRNCKEKRRCQQVPLMHHYGGRSSLEIFGEMDGARGESDDRPRKRIKERDSEREREREKDKLGRRQGREMEVQRKRNIEKHIDDGKYESKRKLWKETDKHR
jgi:hypothetical protein